MIRTTGTVLLAIGFAMLAGAWLITDPTALDANIGAGGLTLIGLPLGALGLLLTLIDAVRAIVRRGSSRGSGD